MIDINRKNYLCVNDLFEHYCNFKNSSACLFNLESSACEFPPHLIPYLNSYIPSDLYNEYSLLRTADPFFDYTTFLSPFEYLDCKRLFNSRRAKASRCRKYLKEMSFKPCLFLTLTFTDSVLNSTTLETRRRYITRYLSSFGVPCIANIDFGKLNEREHYHALIQLPWIDLSSYTFGGMYAELIHNTRHSIMAVSKYVTKFVNHAIKNTTKNRNMIYLHMDEISYQYTSEQLSIG